MLNKDIKVRHLRGSTDTSKSSLRSNSIKAETENVDTKTFMKRYTASFKDPGLKQSDWMIIIAELFVTSAWVCIRERRRVVQELKNRNITEREEHAEFYFWEGWGTLGSLLVGYFVDSHVSYYAMAVFSVVFHFSMISIIFMEETALLYETSNPYSNIIRVILIVAIVVSKSTSFTRLIFGLQNLKTKEHSKVFLFLFLFMWVGDKLTDGGVLWTFIRVFSFHALVDKSIAFLGSGVSFYLYVFLLKPTSSTSRPDEKIGRKIMGCMVSAFLGKLRYRRLVRDTIRVDFLNRRCDTRTVLATKKLIALFQKLSPTIGYALYVTSMSTDFIQDTLLKMKPTGLFYYMGYYQAMRSSVLTTMLITQFGIIPLLTSIDVSSKFHVRFLIGYMAALISVFYTAIVVSVADLDSKLGFSIGHLRVMNVGEDNVSFTSRELDFTEFNFTVAAKSVVSHPYTTAVTKLFKIHIEFEPEVSWTTHLSVKPLAAIGYVLTDPPNLLRIGEIPIEEGPPGTADYQMPRLYLYNTVKNTEFPFVVKEYTTKEVMMRITSRVGLLHVFALPEGEYELSLTNINKVKISINAGGVYGIILHSDGLKRFIHIDKTVPESTVPSSLCIGFVVPAGISLTFAYISLRAMTFISAPTGLLGMSFGFLYSMEYINNWILYIGYRTWHPYPNAATLFTYGFVQLLMFFVSWFVFMKFKSAYTC